MGLSMPELLIILVIIILLFGTKKLKNIGSDLGGALRGFKKAMKDGEEEPAKQEETQKLETQSQRVVDGEVVEDKEKTNS